MTISRKIIELPDVNSLDQLNLKLMLWSVTGEAKFKALLPHDLRRSSGAVAVADVSRQDTIEQLPEHNSTLFICQSSERNLRYSE